MNRELARKTSRVIDPVIATMFAVPYKALHGLTVWRAEAYPIYRWLDYSLEAEQAERESGERAGMTLAEFEARFERVQQMYAIEQHVSMSPRLEDWLRRMSVSTPMSSALREATWAWQRLTRGWDDRSLWSLDRHLCRTLGDQLIKMSEITHGWPESDEFPTFDDWATALRENGEALAAAATDDYLDGDESISGGARESLRWVADHLQSLWD